MREPTPGTLIALAMQHSDGGSGCVVALSRVHEDGFHLVLTKSGNTWVRQAKTYNLIQKVYLTWNPRLAKKYLAHLSSLFLRNPLMVFLQTSRQMFMSSCLSRRFRVIFMRKEFLCVVAECLDQFVCSRCQRGAQSV